MTLNKFRIIDISIFCGLAFFLEVVNGIAVGIVGEVFYLSISVVLSTIALLRWGWYGIIVCFFASFGYLLGNGGQAKHYAIYLIGSVFLGANLLWFKILQKDTLSKNFFVACLFLVSAFLFVNLGRYLVALMFVRDFAIFIDLIAADSLNLVIGIFIIFIAQRQKGLFVDQRDYLVQLSAKNQNDSEATDLKILDELADCVDITLYKFDSDDLDNL
ncbi:MAG: hypothetical protein LBU60_03695 [Clostridiales bacterium]|jgi:hypothetical protein|nr:hypothetical protein [Clostridiales bacterium]